MIPLVMLGTFGKIFRFLSWTDQMTLPHKFFVFPKISEKMVKVIILGR